MQSSPSIFELIRKLKVPIFGSLGPEELAAVAPFIQRKKFAPNQLVFSKGDRAEELFIVISGRLKLSVLSPDGRELAFRTSGPGEVIGEIAALDGNVRTADMTAISDSELLALGRKSLTRLLESRPAFTTEVIRFLCRRLRDTTEQLESIALYPVEARLARLLLAVAERVKRASSPHVEFSLTVSQSELGTVLGASRPKVNVALRKLERAGAIRRRGARVSCNLEKLLEIAECGP
jgi:CRP-like cAMP-binding protein